jgi:hypothetical protein
LPNHPSVTDEAKREELERLTTKRDNARWVAGVGVLLLFAGGLLVQLALGGLVMMAYGSVASVYWSRRIRRIRGDPWAYDPDLDGPQSLERRP